MKNKSLAFAEISLLVWNRQINSINKYIHPKEFDKEICRSFT